MTFADCLMSGPKSPSSLKKSLAKAGIGLLGLAALPFLSGGGASAIGPTARMAVALAVLSAVAYFGLRFLARRNSAAVAESDLRVVARASLSAKNSVALLEADGRRYLVAFGDGFATVLSSSPGEPR